MLIAFPWIFRFSWDSRANLLWHCNLAFSCVASLRTNFLEISLPHTLSNSLSVEELNRLGFNDGCGGVCLLFCQMATNIKILVVSVLSYILWKGLTKLFLSIIKKFVFFMDILRIFYFFRVIWDFLAFPKKVPSQTYDRVHSAPLSL